MPQLTERLEETWLKLEEIDTDYEYLKNAGLTLFRYVTPILHRILNFPTYTSAGTLPCGIKQAKTKE